MADWTAARDLEKAFAEAVHADDPSRAADLLTKLTSMADPWKDHPHYPASATAPTVRGSGGTYDSPEIGP